MTGPVSMADQKADVLRDALFFQSLKPMHDVPMWTLGIEARWYILFPLLFILLHRTRIGFAIAMLGAAWLYRSVGVYDFGFLPTFMLGIVAAQLVKSESKFHAWWPPIAAVLSALAVLTQLHSTAMDHTDLLWALASFALLLAVTTNPQLRRVFSWGPLVTVGLASYSIYLVHMPFLDSLVWAGVPSVVAAIASVAIGFVFWLCVERPLCSRACRTALDAFLVRGYHAMTLGRARVAVRAPSPSSAVAAD
jgi:peptidoglycan/LPS O-acetylase OafA/YrhL